MLAHAFLTINILISRIEVAYQEAVALKRQEELIREEEAAGLAEIELKAKRSAAEKEKRAKKKQVLFLFWCNNEISILSKKNVISNLSMIPSSAIFLGCCIYFYM
jgi:hypothetical protein